jgi:hypothetical protein
MLVSTYLVNLCCKAGLAIALVLVAVANGPILNSEELEKGRLL